MRTEHPFLPYLVWPPEELNLLSGRSVVIAKCRYSFKPWVGPVPFDTYGRKVVLDVGGPVFAELAILRILEKAGWDGVWVDSYRRKFRKCWPDSPRCCCELPDPEQGLFNNIRQLSDWRGGCFDVFAWKRSDHLFVEAKRRGKDRIRNSQRKWLETALTSGVPLESFLIFEWELVNDSQDG